MIARHSELVRNLVLYGLIGGFAALVDYFIFVVLSTHFAVNVYLSNIISMHAGAAVSFPLNAFFNFKTTNKLFSRFLRYYLLVLFGMALTEGLLCLFGLFTSSPWIRKGAALIIVTGLQFIFNKLITFKNDEE